MVKIRKMLPIILFLNYSCYSIGSTKIDDSEILNNPNVDYKINLDLKYNGSSNYGITKEEIILKLGTSISFKDDNSLEAQKSLYLIILEKQNGSKLMLPPETKGIKNNQIEWISSDSTIASVKNGEIIANNTGIVRITAKIKQGKFIYMTEKFVHVVKNLDEIQKIESIESKNFESINLFVKDNSAITGRSEGSFSLIPLDSVQASTNIKNLDLLNWESSDNNIVSVDDKGKIIAKKLGSSTIFASYKLNPSIKGKILINVVKEYEEKVLYPTELVSINIYNENLKPIEGVKIKAKLISMSDGSKFEWESKEKYTDNEGKYLLKTAPKWANINIELSKVGYESFSKIYSTNLAGGSLEIYVTLRPKNL